MIFFDNASSTPPFAEVITEFNKISSENYGNPSSTHKIGRLSRSILDDARDSIATTLGINATKILFTSSATEANNTIIHSLLYNSKIDKILTTKIEHESIIKPLLIQNNKSIVVIPINKNGLLDINYIAAQIDEKSCVALTIANNELGTIQPFQQVIELSKSKGAVTFFDCVQIVGKSSLEFISQADLVSVSSHKIHGLKGAAAIICKNRGLISPFIIGGEQEFAKRAGTENVAAIHCFALALKRYQTNWMQNYSILHEYRNIFLDELKSKSIQFEINTPLEHSIPNILNLSFPGFESEHLQLALDQEGICVSGGSACSSQSIVMSHVMDSLPISDNTKKSAIRFSFSIFNTRDEITECIHHLKSILNRR
ncbi:MAG: cysteine desulfurase [Planctomycetes bacterium]|nr:cysteine desulfurase [Planctomycetota bacterium]